MVKYIKVNAKSWYMENILVDLIQINVYAGSLIQTIRVNSKEICLNERDPNAPSICSEPGGKQWPHSICGWEYDVDQMIQPANIWQLFSCGTVIQRKYTMPHLKPVSIVGTWKLYQLIEAYWHIYASMNLVIIGSDNGLSPSHYLNQCWLFVN